MQNHVKFYVGIYHTHIKNTHIIVLYKIITKKSFGLNQVTI